MAAYQPLEREAGQSDAEPILSAYRQTRNGNGEGESSAFKSDLVVSYSSSGKKRRSAERPDELSGTDGDEGDHSSVTHQDTSDHTPSSTPRKVYRYRWCVLFVCSLVITQEALIWNTWGPIADTAKVAFGWSDGSIALLANWGCIGFTTAALPVSWAMGRKGLRTVFLFAATVCLICTSLRCVSTDPSVASGLINVGHFFNGLSAPVALGAGPLISAKWFPPSERVTSTAIASMSIEVGLAVSFLLGPFLVPDTHCNNTVPVNMSSNWTFNECIGEVRHNIRMLMFVELGFSVFVLLAVLLLVRSEPKTPPSNTGSIPRLEFVPGLKKLSRNGRYFLVSILYGLMNGVFSGWGAVLSLILGAYGISQNDAGFVGFTSTLAGGISGVFTARIADRLARRHKALMICLLIVSFLIFGSLSMAGRISINHGGYFTGLLAVVYITVVTGSVCQYGLIPITLELVVEMAYPVAEGVTSIVTTFCSCFFTVTFLALLYIPGIGVLWMNWVLVSVAILCAAIMLFVRPHYRRLDEDLAVE